MFGRPLSSSPILFHSRWNTVHGTLFSLHGTGVALVTAARFQFGQFVLIVPDRKKAKLFPPPSLRPPTSLALLFFRMQASCSLYFSTWNALEQLFGTVNPEMVIFLRGFSTPERSSSLFHPSVQCVPCY